MKQSKEIDEINTKISILDKDIIQATKQLELFNKYELALKILVFNYNNMSLSEIEKEINTLYEANKKNEVSLKDLESVNLKMIAKGFTKKDVLNTEKLLSKEFENIEFSFENQNRLLKELKDAESAVEVNKNNRAEIIKDIENKEIELKHILGKDYDTEEYLEKLNYDISELNSVLKYFDNIKNHIKLKSTDSVLEIKHNIEKFYEHYKSFKTGLSDFKELSFAKSIIEEADKILDDNKIFLERINKGLQVIDDILSNQNQEKVLGSFFKRNQEEIQEVFQNIHSPKEFEGIEFKGSEIRD